jgi:hypothetical protein
VPQEITNFNQFAQVFLELLESDKLGLKAGQTFDMSSGILTARPRAIVETVRNLVDDGSDQAIFPATNDAYSLTVRSSSRRGSTPSAPGCSSVGMQRTPASSGSPSARSAWRKPRPPLPSTTTRTRPAWPSALPVRRHGAGCRWRDRLSSTRRARSSPRCSSVPRPVQRPPSCRIPGLRFTRLVRAR